jgi:hypothetical protein
LPFWAIKQPFRDDPRKSLFQSLAMGNLIHDE